MAAICVLLLFKLPYLMGLTTERDISPLIFTLVTRLRLLAMHS